MYLTIVLCSVFISLYSFPIISFAAPPSPEMKDVKDLIQSVETEDDKIKKALEASHSCQEHSPIDKFEKLKRDSHFSYTARFTNTPSIRRDLIEQLKKFGISFDEFKAHMFAQLPSTGLWTDYYKKILNEKYSPRSDLSAPLKKLLEEGPNHWVQLRNSESRTPNFQRGISSIDEFTWLMGGNASLEPLDTAILSRGDEEESTDSFKWINQAYAYPVTIRGRVPKFEKIDGSGKEETNLTSLSSATIPKGLVTVESVEAIGTFIPIQMEGKSDTNKRWSESYVQFYRGIMESGIHPSQDSKGYKFFDKLDRLIESHATDESIGAYLRSIQSHL